MQVDQKAAAPVTPLTELQKLQNETQQFSDQITVTTFSMFKLNKPAETFTE